MGMDPIFVFADAGTHISDHNRVYYASSTAKTRTTRHCACVWMGLQMVGHVYHTTSVLLWSTCILRQKQGQNAIAHACGRVCRWWDTYITPQACCYGPHVYYGKNKDKTPLRMRVDGFADGGTRISHHKRAKTAIMYITLHPRQKQRQNAIAHACGRVCRWWCTSSNRRGIPPYPSVCLASRLTPDVHRLKRDKVPLSLHLLP